MSEPCPNCNGVKPPPGKFCRVCAAFTLRKPVRLELPLRTHNPLNGQHGHWSVQARRRKAERGVALMAVRAAGGRSIPPPWLVTLTRVGPRTMDDEGAIASLKSIRDGVADALGVDDGDTERIRFEYHQERGPYAVTVEIASR